MAVEDLVDRTYQPLRTSKGHRPGLMLPKDKAILEGLVSPNGTPLKFVDTALTLPRQDAVNEGGELALADANLVDYWRIDNYAQTLRIFRGPNVRLQIGTNGSVAVNGRNADVILNPPRFKALRVTNESAPHAGYTPLAFDSISYAGSGAAGGIAIWSGSLPTRMVAPRTGFYAVGGNVTWAPSTAGFTRIILLQLNGASFFLSAQVPPCGGGNYTGLSIHTDVHLSVNDYVEVVGYQDTGGVLNITGGGWLHFFSDD